MQSKAVVAVAPRTIQVKTVTSPEPGSEDVVVRVTRSWISNGTEGSYVRGERIGGDTPWREGDPLPFPHVPGYQKVGIVEWAGPEVTHVKAGDSVFASISKIEGMFYNYAGHISPSVSHGSQVWKLPEEADPEAFSGLVLTQVGYNVGIRPQLRAGDAAVVIGDGMVGHWSAQTLRHRGAKVMMLGRHDERLSLLDLRNGDAVVNVMKEDAVEAVRRWAPDGIQVLADTVGTVTLTMDLLPTLRRYGHIVSAGFYGANGLLDVQRLRDQELTLHAPSGWSPDRMAATLDLVARGAIQTKHLITHRFPVSRADEAFALILDHPSPALGVVLEWD